MPLKTPTPWNQDTPQPANFEPYGPSNPTVFTENDNGAPTDWSPEDTKNPTTYTLDTKNPSTMAPTFGIETIGYGSADIGYGQANVGYGQYQINQPTPAALVTDWTQVA